MEQGDAWYKYGDLETMEGKKNQAKFFLQMFCFVFLGCIEINEMQLGFLGGLLGMNIPIVMNLLLSL